MSAGTTLEAPTVNARIKISALWTSMLFVFAYVDLFSLYRADVRKDLEAGEIGGFDVNQAFLLGTTAYVVIPSLMVVLALVLPPRVARIGSIALGSARTRSQSSPAQLANGTTTSSAAPSKSHCSRASSTREPGRRKPH